MRPQEERFFVAPHFRNQCRTYSSSLLQILLFISKSIRSFQSFLYEIISKFTDDRLCTRAGMLESFLVCPGELTDDQVMELLKISFRQPEVVLALAKMVHDVHEKQNVPNPL